MPVNERNTRLMVTLPKEIADKVREEAEKENRTMSNMVQTIILDFFKGAVKND